MCHFFLLNPPTSSRLELTGMRNLPARGHTPHAEDPMGGFRKLPVMRCRAASAGWLAPNTQLLQNRLIALRVRVAQIGQKPPALGDHGQQTFAGAMVLLVRLEMLGELADTAAQEGYLYFCRPGIGSVALIGG